MVYKVNLRFRRLGYGTVQITGLNTYYIGLTVPFTTRALSVSGPHHLAKSGFIPGPATISPCTITMDHNAIVCFMTDRLT